MRPPPGWEGVWHNPRSVERLTRRVPDPVNPDKFSMLPTNTFVATFEDFALPPYVVVLGKRIYLKPFVQRVFKCDHCCRFSHTKRICKSLSSLSICCKYGLQGHVKNECFSEKLKCINSVRKKYMFLEHAADDNSCPVYVYQREFRLIMSSMCLGLREAEYVYGKGVRYHESRVDSWPASTLAEFIVKPTYADITRDCVSVDPVQSFGGGPFPVTRNEPSSHLQVAPETEQNTDSSFMEFRKRRRVASRNVPASSIRSGAGAGGRGGDGVRDFSSADPTAYRKEYNRWSRLPSGVSRLRDDPGGNGGTRPFPLSSGCPLGIVRGRSLSETDVVADVSGSVFSHVLGNISTGPSELVKGNAFFACLNKANKNVASTEIFSE